MILSQRLLIQGRPAAITVMLMLGVRALKISQEYRNTCYSDLNIIQKNQTNQQPKQMCVNVDISFMYTGH